MLYSLYGHLENKRFFRHDNVWYYKAREGAVGPFLTKEDAVVHLDKKINEIKTSSGNFVKTSSVKKI